MEADLKAPESARRPAPDPRTLLFFVHLPKTGGTSFVALLRRVYGRRFLHVKRARRLRLPEQYMLQAIADQLRAVGGHFPYGFHRKFGSAFDFLHPGREGAFAARDIKCISIMRDPIERVQSLYRYILATPSHRLHARVKDLPPSEFLRVMQELGHDGAGASNQQSRLIGKGCSGDLDAIKRRIREDYFAVGVLEDIDPFVEHLARTLGWPAEARMSHLNKSRQPPGKGDFDAETIAWIRRNNEDDIALYEFVREEGRRYWKS